MEILITVVVVVGMIAVVALAIHLLNGRHRRRHLAAVPLDHGLAVFHTPPAGGGGHDAPPPPDSR
ncbi:hypothetical protein ACGFR8_12375 [Streptomyces brevispora]|uniref:hypothetical protein n=1 Tax=Streptomyces brevispora TaxID=887462 RepID=UPI003724317E